jgi:hypothetical protein
MRRSEGSMPATLHEAVSTHAAARSARAMTSYSGHVPAKKRVGGRPRAAQAPPGAELDALVRADCLARFKAFASRAWDTRTEGELHAVAEIDDGLDGGARAEASKVHHALRGIVDGAVDDTLRAWLSERVEQLAVEMRGALAPPQRHADVLAVLLRRFDTPDFLGLGRTAEDTELAVVALLCFGVGDLVPRGRSVKAFAVIEKMRDRVQGRRGRAGYASSTALTAHVDAELEARRRGDWRPADDD